MGCKRIRRERHVTRAGRREIEFFIVAGSIILKWILKKGEKRK
jgi:hypothetical protein